MQAVGLRAVFGGCELFRRARHLDDRPGFQVGGFQPPVECPEPILGDAEAARKRIEGFARFHDVVGETLLGYAVERIAVGLPLLPRAGLVFGADLLLADQDALPEAQVHRVEVGVVLDDGLDRDLVFARDAVERFALRHGMDVEGLAQFALRLGLGDVRYEGDLDALPCAQPLRCRGVMLQDDLLPHLVGLRKPVERFAGLHRVDVEFRAVDIHDRPGFLHRKGAQAPQEQQGCRTESLHRHFVFSRIRISVMTFLV